MFTIAIMTQTVDVLIIGAGLSGIGAAYHLQEQCPGKTYAILERRAASGGTWDLFRYPGIRSDSDMHTLGYIFKPWKEEKAIADGPSILNYVRETSEENGIEQHIRYNHHVKKARWVSDIARWHVEVQTGAGEMTEYTCQFILNCSGYYNYDGGYRPDFPGEGEFQGEIVHPQQWPEDLDYAGKRVVVIGSGATAVTLVPQMAKTAGHVTMLQRSPTYVVSRPAEDAMANRLRKILPAKTAYSITRWKNILLSMFFFNMARKNPAKVKDRMTGMVRDHLGPDFDVAKHFTPTYNPWDQRLCLVPDADLFGALKDGSASVATDHIETFTAEGIRLKSGEELKADIVVSATGLELIFLGGIDIEVDGVAIEPGKILNYRGLMFEGIPNLISTFGYTNASWTLKADLTADFACRLIRHMDRAGLVEARPVNDDPTIGAEPFLDFSSGYVQRAVDKFPKQGTAMPWRQHQNYIRDIFTLRHAKFDDGVLTFRKPGDAILSPPVHVAEPAASMAAE